MKKILRQSFVILAMLAGGFLTGACKDGAQPTPAAGGPVEVEVVTLQPQPVHLVVELPGRTAAFRIAEVRPQVGGIIQKRLFTEGSEVKAGQLLYQIDPATYQASYDSAKAALAKAEALEHSASLKAERYRVLVRTKAVSEQEQIEIEAGWKQAVADVAAAKAALASARINLDYTRVTAPISGRIGKSSVTEGALVTAQQSAALATIQQLDPLYVDVSQSSTELLDLKKEVAAGSAAGGEKTKSEVTVLLEDGSEYRHTGSLEFSDVTVNQTTGTVTLRAIVGNPDQELLPGMFVRARIDKGQKPAAILVPAASISRNSKGQAMVMVVNKASTVENRIVHTGQNIGTRILIADGLTAGEQVIVAGLQKIKPGVPVKVIEQAIDNQSSQTASGVAATAAKTE
ncbi:efflux transporter, RND family, MFP subunit [Desulfobulbus propionicus DSM 2032]|jgi:membrane fusion protein (multidrug efflux system)|uniref:Efflux transporter, RND family, MFP subunit n=1 Tax=Desulfobulbus propionicus (strain ATCC 33891 / DSM 2032 / VKM B-1956 / 1pr3) TaxID=577650 RepID=A0A7U4DNX9_DESPD|nr:efflux RND transporter periplasmic adaptor subunit [Desulfobulbus propionicus]ADW17484.1 efflux transporter, RND family, MFP subunit [Desulfobulbus propionicus DSM 2032]